jgi:antitoxin MazE
MKVAKWGNSLAIRLPQAVVEALQLKEGDDIKIEADSGRTFQVAKKPSRKQLLDRLNKYRRRIPSDFKFDRWEANARR